MLTHSPTIQITELMTQILTNKNNYSGFEHIICSSVVDISTNICHHRLFYTILLLKINTPKIYLKFRSSFFYKHVQILKFLQIFIIVASTMASQKLHEMVHWLYYNAGAKYIEWLNSHSQLSVQIHSVNNLDIQQPTEWICIAKSTTLFQSNITYQQNRLNYKFHTVLLRSWQTVSYCVQKSFKAFIMYPLNLLNVTNSDP